MTKSVFWYTTCEIITMAYKKKNKHNRGIV